MFKRKRKISVPVSLKKYGKSRSAFEKKIIFIISILVFLAAIYGIFFSDYFEIKRIRAQSEEYLDESVRDKVISALNKEINKNLLFIDLEKIEKDISQNFPQIQKTEIEKIYPDQIIINYREYPFVANYIHETPQIKKSYIINSQGQVIKEDLEKPGLTYIYEFSEENFNKNSPAIGSENLQYMLEAKKYFEEKFGINLNKIVYKRIAREVHLETEKNFRIWLDLQIDFAEQLKKLKKALVKLDIHNENLEYIDLRIAGNNGDKIIFKRRN